METEQICSRYETVHYDVINFSHKQLLSGHMNFIPVFFFFNLHIHRNGTKGLRNTYRVPGLKQIEEESNLWSSFIVVCGTEL